MSPFQRIEQNEILINVKYTKKIKLISFKPLQDL